MSDDHQRSRVAVRKAGALFFVSILGSSDSRQFGPFFSVEKANAVAHQESLRLNLHGVYEGLDGSS